MTTLITGYEFDMSSTVLRLGAITFDGLEDYTCGIAVEGEKMLYGTKRLPRRRTRGVIKPKQWSFTMPAAEYNRMIALPPFSVLGYLEAVVDFQIEKKEIGVAIPRFQIDRLVGARIIDVEESGKSGGDPTMVKVSGSLMDYKRDRFFATTPEIPSL